MTKKEAEQEFREFIMPIVRHKYEQDGVPDWPARREAWNNYVDSLARDGQITERQAGTWTHPSIVQRPKRRW